MLENVEACPYCGANIMKGAMRCPGCGKILKTAEEQTASIKKHMEARKKFNYPGLVKLIIFIIAASVVYYYYYDQIVAFVKSLLEKI